MSLVLIQALEKCATKFEQYANYHGEKGSADKARDNKAMVHMVNAAISSHYPNHNLLPLRIVEIDQHLVDLKRVQIVCPVVNGKFSLTMVSGIDAHCSDATMYEEVRQAYLNYMKWEQSLDAPSVTTVNAVGDVISLKSEVGQVKPKCVITTVEDDQLGNSSIVYKIGNCQMGSIYRVRDSHIRPFFDVNGQRLTYKTFAEADSAFRSLIKEHFDSMFVC